MNNENKVNIKKIDFFWNMIGTVFYSAISFFAPFVVINILGAESGGLFSFGYVALSQIVYIIAYFGTRSYHIVDVVYKYKFSEYFANRIITSIIAIIFGYIYISILLISKVYTFEKGLFLYVVIFSGVIEGFFDVYESELQRGGKLYIAGILLFIRTLVFFTVFVIVLYNSKNMILATACGIVSKFVVSILLANVFLKNEDDLYKGFNKNSLIKITIEVFPIFLMTLLDSYIYSSSKFAIDLYMNDYSSGLFNVLFIPSNIIYMICMFLMRPILTPMSELYHTNKKAYEENFLKVLTIAISICILIFVLVLFFGKSYLQVINIITSYKYKELMDSTVYTVFMVTLAGGLFYTINTPTYYLLIIEGKKNNLMYMYIVIFLISIFTSNILVKNLGMLGAGINYFAIMFLLNLFIQGIKFVKWKK